MRLNSPVQESILLPLTASSNQEDGITGMPIHPITAATLETLERAVWFSKVGIKDTKVAIVLSSWQEAIDHCSAPEWEDLCLEATNQYCERIVERSLDRWRKWNQTVDEIKRFTEPLVSTKIAAVVEQHKLPRVFQSVVSWDILFVCMEAEYSDVYPPGFFADQAHWYVRGHFPCGWEGEFPKGKLIIY